jgi:hypothetical protein
VRVTIALIPEQVLIWPRQLPQEKTPQ